MARKDPAPKKEKTVAVGVRLTEGVLAKLDRVALSRGTRRSPFVSTLIEKYLRKVA